MKRAIVLMAVSVVLLSGCSENNMSGTTKNNAGSYSVDTIDQTDTIDEKTESENETIDFELEPSETDSILFDIENNMDDFMTADNDQVIEIREKLFVTQCNDIYINAEEYLGKTIKYEGIFQSFYWEGTDTTYYSVIRYGPGCCANDANVGFEIIWDDEYPDQDDWVEVLGVLEAYEEDGYDYLRLRLSSLEVLSVRGNETVVH